MDIDGKWKLYKVARGATLTPAQWKIFETGKRLGQFMTFRQQQEFLELVRLGLLSEPLYPPDGSSVATDKDKKKPAKRPKPRPDTITTTNEKRDVPYSITVQYSNGTQRTVTSKTTVLTDYVFDQKSGSYDPKWVWKKFPDLEPFEWLQPTTYTRCVKKKTVKGARVIGKSPNVVAFDVPTGTMNSVITGAFWNSTALPSVPKQLARLKFHSQLADMKVDVMTFLGEAKSSFRMIGDAAADIFEIYRSVRSGNMRRANAALRRRGLPKPRKISKRPDQRWLEYQYGWAPLIGDITKAFQEIVDGRETPTLFYAKASSQFAPSPYNTNVNTQSTMGEYFVKCWYALKADKTARKMAEWNLGSNPFLTGWELVPYSFVIDWFIPIGDFLQQYSSDNGLHFVSGTEAWRVQYTADLTSTQRFSAGTGWVDLERKIFEETFYYRRNVLTSTPFASYPPFNPGASIRRFLNGLALITVRKTK